MTTIKPIALNSDNYVPRSGQAVKVMGYGAVNIAGNKYPTKMKHVDLKAQSHKQCAKAFRGKIDKNTMLCAAARRKDSCYGGKLDYSTASNNQSLLLSLLMLRGDVNH